MAVTLRLPIAVVAVLALVACGGTQPTPALEPATQVTVTATETVTVTIAPSPEPVASSDGPEVDMSLAVGDTHDGPSASLQVTDYKVVEEYGMVMSGLKVSACNKTKEVLLISSEAWVALDAEGGRYTPTYGTSDKMKPSYPTDGYDPKSETAPGDCLVGWILFDADGLVSVRYKSQVNGEATWVLPGQ